MKITKKNLQKLINEELQKLLQEQAAGPEDTLAKFGLSGVRGFTIYFPDGTMKRLTADEVVKMGKIPNSTVFAVNQSGRREKLGNPEKEAIRQGVARMLGSTMDLNTVMSVDRDDGEIVGPADWMLAQPMMYGRRAKMARAHIVVPEL